MTYCIVTLFFTLKGLKDMGEKKAINCTFFSQLNESSVQMITDHLCLYCMKCPKYDGTTILFNPQYPKAI